MEELAAEVLNRLLGSATSIQTVRGDGEPVSNLILRQRSPLSLPLPSFYSFFLSSWGPDEAGSECGLGIKREWGEEKGSREGSKLVVTMLSPYGCSRYWLPIYLVHVHK